MYRVSADDPDLLAARCRNRFSIIMVCQPPNTPDYNILDFGFFHGIQALRYKMPVKTTEELVHVVCAAFDAYMPRKLDDTFISLEKCMECSMLASSGKNYKQPHLHKQRRRNEGNPIEKVQCAVAEHPKRAAVGRCQFIMDNLK